MNQAKYGWPMRGIGFQPVKAMVHRLVANATLENTVTLFV